MIVFRFDQGAFLLYNCSYPLERQKAPGIEEDSPSEYVGCRAGAWKRLKPLSKAPGRNPGNVA